MKVEETNLSGVLLLHPLVFTDERGCFLEAFNAATFREAGLPIDFFQDNHSSSKRNVLRGLHYQVNKPQGKLVRVAYGEIFDVVVDCRRSAPTFGRWLGVLLSDRNRKMLWVPSGFAHGFLARSEHAEVTYKVTAPYSPADERTILWSDPEIGIDWQLSAPPIISPKDSAGLPFSRCELFA